MTDLREIALEFPETVEKLTWGEHPTFRVRDKMFAVLSEDERSARIKATKEAQQALVGSEPRTYSIAPYLGRHGWVAVDLDRVDPEELDELLEEAWRLTAPKKMVRAFDETAIQVDVEIRGDTIRLGQLLKFSGVASSGDEAKAILAEGGVRVNGKPEDRRGAQLHPGDIVHAGGEQILLVSSD